MVEDSSTMIALLFVGRRNPKDPRARFAPKLFQSRSITKYEKEESKMSMLSKTILIQLNQIQSFFKEKRPVF